VHEGIRRIVRRGGLLAPVVLAVAIAAVPGAARGQRAPGSPPETVGRVDLRRYAGLWHEYAKLPNDFQDQCVAGTTAEYALRDDGKLDVVNRCETSDGVDVARGIARVVEGSGNAKLEVSFVQVLGFSLFWGDYWIVGLDEDYEWAVVGHPERKYGWLLVRDPAVSEAVRDEMFFVLESRGYDHEAFVRTPHGDRGGGASR